MANCAPEEIDALIAGFINGLSIARSFIENGQYRKILVTGVEKLSSFRIRPIFALSRRWSNG